MANEEQLAILKQGIDVWNEWRQSNHEEIYLVEADLSAADLRGADLKGAYLMGANLRNANLQEADLTEAHLWRTNLQEANLQSACLSRADLHDAKLYEAKLCRTDFRKASLNEAGMGKANLYEANLEEADVSNAYLQAAYLRKANLREANLSGADLTGADLVGAFLRDAILAQANLSDSNLYGATLSDAVLTKAILTRANLGTANLSKANLSGTDLSATNFEGANLSAANLIHAHMVGTQLQGATLTNCRIFAIAVWNIELEGTTQSNLVITDLDEPEITVDNLEVAQFIYLLLHNEKLRDVIDTITSKAVLILGRFTDERKAVLEAIREELRHRNYVPILFDFDKPPSRDVTETVAILAHMSRFVIADLTDAKSIPQELSHIVPDLPSVAVQPLILSGQREYGMFEHFQRYPWVLPIHEYESQDQLIADLTEKVIKPAEAKVVELRPAK